MPIPACRLIGKGEVNDRDMLIGPRGSSSEDEEGVKEREARVVDPVTKAGGPRGLDRSTEGLMLGIDVKVPSNDCRDSDVEVVVCETF